MIHRSSSTSYNSPNPLRPLNSDLLRALGQARDGLGLELTLIKEIQGKEDHWSQVWTCDVQVNGKTLGTIVAKFLVQSLFPFPQDTPHLLGKYRWKPAVEIARREAQAYAAFRDSAQGVDVPWCYGFYRFRMPWGEEVIGILLEDLSEPHVAQTIAHCVGSNVAEYGEPGVEAVDALILNAFLTQRRLQDREIIHFRSEPSDILILATESSNGDPHIVFLDFGECLKKDEKVPGPALPPKPKRWRIADLSPAVPKHEDDWRAGDERILSVAFSDVMGDVASEWMSHERLQNRVRLCPGYF
ncbi:uncharacterized protein JCM6883_000357 [Sporobolomyces salmoneus]|uniref:uncharacterized protein n=1 Tax=Sporobolomyces salmoneus TaxID=183962 RepID=UPI003180E042